MDKLSRISIFAMVAAMAAGMSHLPIPGFSRRSFREPKNYPRMVTSTREEIAAHNSAVTTRQVLRRQSRPWKIAKRWDAAA